jgi:outer membrane protein OmpA-like peptidoglycan-associated protein
MRAAVLTAFVGVMLSTTSVVALAADPCLNPSDDMIFSCLKPGKTRGIRPGGVPAAAAEPAPAPVATPASRPVREAVVRPQPLPSREAAPAPVAQAPVAQTQPAESSGGRVDLALQFASGSADTTPEARARLDGLGRQLARPELADLRFRIEGHTDTTGSREANKALSQRRAEAIVTYLTTKFGLPAGKLEPIGVGEDNPPVPTAENVSEPRNRVVRIVAIGG